MGTGTVALIGAGAVGAYFIEGFCERLGERFCLVAEKERLKRLRTEGIKINGKRLFPQVKTPEEAHGPDVLLICTKGYALADTLDAIVRTAGENTTILSLLNGLDSEEIIAEKTGEARVLHALMLINAERRDGEIRFNYENTRGVRFGEKDTAAVTPRMEKVAALFDEGRIRYEMRKDIRTDIWGKYAVNVCYNLPQAVLGVNNIAYYNSTHVAFLRDKLFEEVAAVGKAEGIDVPQIGRKMGNTSPAARFSTLQDLDAKRRTEADLFPGTLLALAKKHGIEVPYATYTWHALKALEEKNEGLFD